MNRDARLGILASAILDGKPVDWEKVSGTTADESDRAIVRQLQIVSEIAALHRNLPDPDASPAADVTTSLEETRPAIEWGHLRLLEMVGRGTYGEVFRAWDTQLDREVALKLLRATDAAGDVSASLSDPSRVVHEGRLLARVRHPHVITVHGAEPRDGRVGIWMEFIRGRTLHQIVEQQGPLGAREAAAVGIDLCQALAAVHRAGLLHRDVTARNVMREEGGRVVLMDFGAGHDYQTAAAELKGSVTGTPLYMAPELFAGGTIDQRTDIYALGVLLYHLVTGGYPVMGRTFDDIRDKHRAGERTRLRDVRADVPGAFVQAVEKAIAANPLERCHTAGELETMLERALVGTREATASQPARVPWRLVAASTVLVAGVVVAATAPTVLKSWRAASASASGGAPAAAAAADVIARKISPSDALMLWSNPSGDGRYVAATTTAGGDIAIADLTTGQYRALGMGRDDYSEGYASMSALSSDGTAIAANWWHEDRGSLRIIRSDGSGRRILIDSARDAFPYQWSRDGSLILAMITGEDGTQTIALVAVADGAVRPLAKLGSDIPEMMSLSPDGRYVVYDYPEAPRARDRDIFIVDAHTGTQRMLIASPGHDSFAMWAPNGREILFLSDRARAMAVLSVAVANGATTSVPRIVKDDVGRVWPRGFTRDGALHYQFTTGFAEVYVGALDGSAPAKVISPREALSNYYPKWSLDGRFIVYTSARHAGGSRDLWVYDVGTATEEAIPSRERLGAPMGWSPDGTRILARGQGSDELYIVHRATGQARRLADSAYPSRWLSEGIVSRQQKSVTLYDPSSDRVVRFYDFGEAAIKMFSLGLDGRTAMALWTNGRVTVRDVVSGQVREWHEAGALAIGNHAAAPHGSMVAYSSNAKDSIGEFVSIKIWPGTGDARELMRVRAPERLVLWGWTPDGQQLLVTRWTAPGKPGDQRSLWRVPVFGGQPVAIGPPMEALRDLSIRPDGRYIAFNVGFTNSEYWVMENLLAK